MYALKDLIVFESEGFKLLLFLCLYRVPWQALYWKVVTQTKLKWGLEASTYGGKERLLLIRLLSYIMEIQR